MWRPSESLHLAMTGWWRVPGTIDLACRALSGHGFPQSLCPRSVLWCEPSDAALLSTVGRSDISELCMCTVLNGRFVPPSCLCSTTVSLSTSGLPPSPFVLVPVLGAGWSWVLPSSVLPPCSRRALAPCPSDLGAGGFGVLLSWTLFFPSGRGLPLRLPLCHPGRALLGVPSHVPCVPCQSDVPMWLPRPIRACLQPNSSPLRGCCGLGPARLRPLGVMISVSVSARRGASSRRFGLYAPKRRIGGSGPSAYESLRSALRLFGALLYLLLLCLASAAAGLHIWWELWSTTDGRAYCAQFSRLILYRISLADPHPFAARNERVYASCLGLGWLLLWDPAASFIWPAAEVSARGVVLPCMLAVTVSLFRLLLKAGRPNKAGFGGILFSPGEPTGPCWIRGLGSVALVANGPLSWPPMHLPPGARKHLGAEASVPGRLLRWSCGAMLRLLRVPIPVLCHPHPALQPCNLMLPRRCKGHDGPGLTAPEELRETRRQETIGPPMAPPVPYNGRPPIFEVDRPERVAAGGVPAFIYGHFCVLCPNTQGEVVTLALRAPCESAFALSEINEARFPERQGRFPCLFPATPQPLAGVGIVLGMPVWV